MLRGSLFKRLNGTLGGRCFSLYHSFSGVLTHQDLISGLFVMRRNKLQHGFHASGAEAADSPASVWNFIVLA